MAEYYLEQEFYFDPLIWEESGPVSWRTKDGSYIPITDMTQKHIKNCLFLLQAKKEFTDSWIEIFQEELKERKNARRLKN